MLLDELLGHFGFNQEKTLHQLVFLEVPAKVVGAELIYWGQASWWPPKVSFKLRRKTIGDLKVGTQYELKYQFPFSFSSELEVTRYVPDRVIEHTFIKGALRGQETILVEERYNGTKISYTLKYRIKGLGRKILWSLLLGRLHSANIKMILMSLKEHILKMQGDTTKS